MEQMIFNAILDHIPLWAYLVFGGIVLGVLLYFFGPILIPIWNMLPSPIKVFLVGTVAVLGAFLGGRYRGNKDERDAEQKRNAEAQQKRKEVDNEVDKASESKVKNMLNPWYRD